MGLILKAGAWYVAACEAGRRDVRTYRLASYWRDSSARFEAELRPLQARVSLSPRALGWLIHARSQFVEPAPLRSMVAAMARRIEIGPRSAALSG
ncbi:MAG: hypothetical protein H7Z15_21840 [Rhizobacter sp.]|nr:hypothetical protein [Rhizobacter sp.]